ncbi:hypothetical protein LTR66_009363 [Elasticomyces elasticus]|nr:hypothetical protein LTR66_009363 [Elasticomyces elasticus]KAK4988059.1 hypothetical protein LTR50_004175 [Elasticomyces elasticus]
MSDIQLYLFEADKDEPEALRIAAQTADRLQRKELRLVALIESIGEYLNSDETPIRTKSIRYLGDVLSATPPKVLTTQQRGLLLDFILSRVADDNETIGPSARALLALERLSRWDKDAVGRVMTTFLDNTNPLKQFKQQSERFSILQLIDLLLSKYRDFIRALHESSNDFLPAFISYFDGEKDPRNLMIIFSILQVPMIEWDVSSNAQDLFDAVFNYFPITFKPPPDDPYGITAQQLKDRLRECVAATSDFAPYAFPALLDKLDSSSINTKRDVLHAIISCIEGYEARTISMYSVTLWDALKFEILNLQEEDLAEQALEVLSAIARQLATNTSGSLNAYLKPIIKESNEHIEDAPTKQSQAAGRILKSISKSSPQVCDLIIKGILPNLFMLFQASESIAKRRGLIEVLNEIVESSIYDVSQSRENTTNGNHESALSAGALRAFSGEALDALWRAVVNGPRSEVSFRLLAIKGLEQLARVPHLLSDQEVVRIVDALVDIILQEEENQADIRVAATKAIVDIARHYPEIIANHAFPSLMVRLPDVPEEGSTSYEVVLEAFAQLSAENKIFDTVVVRLKNKINAAVHLEAPHAYVLALLKALVYAFSNGTPSVEDEAIRLSYYDDLVQPLLTRALEVKNCALHTEMGLDAIGRLCNIIVQAQGFHRQSQIYATVQRMMKDVQDSLRVSDSKTSASDVDTSATIPLLYFIAAFRRELVPVADAHNLLAADCNGALHQQLASAAQLAVLRRVSLVVNKFLPPASLQAVLESLEVLPPSLLSISSLSLSSIRLGFALTKGLLLRNHHATLAQYLPAFIQLLSEPEHGQTVARGFATLLAPDDLLSKENYCVIAGLHKQKAFNMVVPAITTAVRTCEVNVKPNYLIALSGIIRWLPYSIIEPELVSLIPLLLQCLDLADFAYQDIKAATITVLTAVLMHNPDKIDEHASSLINRLLNCTAVRLNTPKVRAAALQCLGLIPKQLKQETVIPFRRQATKRLAAALDDRKRDVRVEAVKCRSAWMSLDEVEDEDAE